MLDPFHFRTSLTILLVAGFVGLATGCNSNDDYHGGSGFVTQAVAVGDLNGSGGLDILTANAVYQDGSDAPGFLTSRLQNPASSGAFLDPLRSETGVYPLALAIGDLDGDGRPDAVVANYLASSSTNRSVDVHFQSATAGTFLAPTHLTVGTRRPLDVVVADLTGAGRLDVVVAASGSNDVLVFFHDTTPGSFQAPVSFAVSGDPASVAVADLTGSGSKDLVVAMANGKVAVLLHGPVAGTFLSPVDYTTGADPVAVKIADVDGDSHPDILTANYSNGTGGLSILRQNAATPGTFLAAQTLDTGDYASAGLAIGDLDGDGHPDVVVANAGLPGYPGSVAVFRQDPAHAGVFPEPDLYRGYYGPLSVAIADLKGDGKPALVVADGDPAVRWPDPLNPGQFQPPVWLRQ
ncbi:MAG: VCBS repeat-containing protein [Holophaga sp.]|nr:VCBS repeat-containing protein [Holophaga sp.]